MSYHGTLERLTDRTRQQVLAVFDMWLAGKVTGDQFAQLVAAFIATANGRAIALADLSLAATLSVDLGAAVPAIGLAAPWDPARLQKAATTLLAVAAQGEDITDRLARIAHVEPSEAAARAWSRGLAASRKVKGWSRRMEPRACQLCQWWARDGHVWPKDHPMPTHKGCQCTPQPITKEIAR